MIVCVTVYSQDGLSKSIMSRNEKRGGREKKRGGGSGGGP